jgi:hypothetical protein
MFQTNDLFSPRKGGRRRKWKILKTAERKLPIESWVVKPEEKVRKTGGAKVDKGGR